MGQIWGSIHLLGGKMTSLDFPLPKRLLPKQCFVQQRSGARRLLAHFGTAPDAWNNSNHDRAARGSCLDALASRHSIAMLWHAMPVGCGLFLGQTLCVGQFGADFPYDVMTCPRSMASWLVQGSFKMSRTIVRSSLDRLQPFPTAVGLWVHAVLPFHGRNMM